MLLYIYDIMYKVPVGLKKPLLAQETSYRRSLSAIRKSLPILRCLTLPVCMTKPAFFGMVLHKALLYLAFIDQKGCGVLRTKAQLEVTARPVSLVDFELFRLVYNSYCCI